MSKLIRSRGFLYGIYIIGLTLAFLYLLFPSDTVKAFLADRLGQTDPDITVSIERLRPALPPGVKLEQVQIRKLGTELFSVDTMRVAPKWFSLLRGDKKFSFVGQAYSGNISGLARIDSMSEPREIDIEADVSGIQLEGIAAVRNFAKRTLSGRLNAEVIYQQNPPRQQGSGKLSLSQVQVDLKIPLIKQEALMFKTVEADVILDDRRVAIKECRMQGSEMDGIVSGSISLPDTSGVQQLDLTGILRPHHAFLAKIRQLLPANMLSRLQTGDDGIGFRIYGTTDAPKFSLN